jgi:NAD(P)-dependent dehydrogenase (short-subunit alcohol dehydrogenase family)
MQLSGSSTLVTGGASGLGLATARHLLAAGAQVVIVDLPSSDGQRVAETLGKGAHFAAADVTDDSQMTAALDLAEGNGPLRAVVHCAGRGGALRILDREGQAANRALFEEVVRINLVGTFNVLRLVASRMAKAQPIEEERGVIVLTSSIAAYEGQIGQLPYASAKAGIVGMTLVAARDLADRQIRVCTIAPGVFDTPILARLPENVRTALGKAVPHPSRLGRAPEFAMLAVHMIENPMINGETIRLDGAMRMTAR